LLKVGVSLEMAELFPYLDKNIDNPFEDER